jgi:hypothetical protein
VYVFSAHWSLGAENSETLCVCARACACACVDQIKLDHPVAKLWADFRIWCLQSISSSADTEYNPKPVSDISLKLYKWFSLLSMNRFYSYQWKKDVRRTFLLLLYQIEEHGLCFVSFQLCYEPHSVAVIDFLFKHLWHFILVSTFKAYTSPVSYRARKDI